MIRTKTVYDLPVEPTGGIGDRIVQTYVTELKKVKTPEELKAFSERWKNVFLLRCEERDEDSELTPEEVSIVEGTYDPQEALQCIEANKQKPGPETVCKHIAAMKKTLKENPKARFNSCVGMHLALPGPLAKATLLAQKFGCPTDTALLQMGRAFCPIQMAAVFDRQIVVP